MDVLEVTPTKELTSDKNAYESLNLDSSPSPPPSKEVIVGNIDLCFVKGEIPFFGGKGAGTVNKTSKQYKNFWLKNIKQLASPDSKLKTLNDELQQLRKLASNWNSYGAEPPNNIAVTNAEKILNLLFSRGIGDFPKRIVPSAEGGAAFIYIDDSKYADIECFNDGKIFVGISHGSEQPKIWEITTEQTELSQTLEKINAFLQN